MAELPHVLVAGALAGMVEGLTVQPLEMVKTRFQINTGEGRRVGSSATLPPTLPQLYLRTLVRHPSSFPHELLNVLRQVHTLTPWPLLLRAPRLLT